MDRYDLAVVGLGVVGTSVAYEAARRGLSVCAFEAGDEPALDGASFANAAQLSYACSAPWAAPGIPFKAFRWLLDPLGPVAFRPDWKSGQLRWILALLARCNPDDYAASKAPLAALSKRSREVLQTWRAELGDDDSWSFGDAGLLQIIASAQGMKNLELDAKALDALGVGFEILDRAGLERAEPGLAFSRRTLLGGCRLPGDQSGDCKAFCDRLAASAKSRGADLFFGVPAASWKSFSDDGILTLSGSSGAPRSIRASRLAVCLGARSGRFLEASSIGPRIPVYPMSGYSLTCSVASEAAAPRSTILDEQFKVAATRLGSRLRVGGMAELAGFSKALNPKRKATLSYVLESLFPGAGNLSDASFWRGHRPSTPDSVPLVGPTLDPLAFLAAGHGTLGWTQAAGTAELLLDLICGKTPSVDPAPHAPERWARDGFLAC